MADARWLDHAPQAWGERLALGPGASASHRPETWKALASALPGLRIPFLAIESGGRLLGGMPVAIERRASLHWLHAMPMLLPAPPLAEPGREREVDAVAIAAFARLAAEHAVVGGEWSWYRPGQAAPEPGALAVLGEVRMYEAAVIALGPGLEAIQARMDRKFRQALRQGLGRGFAFADEPGALESAYQLHVAQGRRWAGHRALPLELARRLLAAPADPALAHVFTLRDARGLLSATLVLDTPHETFLWWSGTHPEGRRAGAFPVLAWHVIEWAISRGRRRVNLGASTGLEQVASFKQAFGALGERYPVVWIDARHARGPVRAVAAWQRLLRRGRPQGEPT